MSNLPIVFAIAAHPDDIEFQMAGTLLLLRDLGCEIHYMNIANGCCGTSKMDKAEIIALRLKEAQNAADKIGAIFHPPLVDDFGIFYNQDLIARVAAAVRKANPNILLLQSPRDYMEDHENAVRVAVTAAFTRGMIHFQTTPPQDPVNHPIAIYHAQPHGNKDPMGHEVKPDIFVDIESVMQRKTEALACHESQKSWLDESQGMDSYLIEMQKISTEVGAQSKNFRYAEGWRKHSHLGFSTSDYRPLETSLQNYITYR